MYKTLSSEDIVDIVMFMNQNGIGSNPNFVINSYSTLADFEMRSLRNLFFNYRVIGYGDVIIDSGETVINDLVLYTRSVTPKASHIYLSLSSMNNVHFLKHTISDIWANNKDILKIKALLLLIKSYVTIGFVLQRMPLLFLRKGSLFAARYFPFNSVLYFFIFSCSFIFCTSEVRYKSIIAQHLVWLSQLHFYSTRLIATKS